MTAAGRPTEHHRRRFRDAVERLFGGGDETADRLDAVATLLDVPGGTVLFREGDAGDSAFIVLSGRLRPVLDAADGELALSDAVAGETVGELGLLTGAPRSATVYAVRDSVVARIAAADFDAFLRERPEHALPILRILAARLQRLARTEQRSADGRTVAILPLGGVDARAVAHELAAAIEPARPTLVLDARAVGEPALEVGLEDQGPPGRVLIGVGEPGWTGWDAALLRQADEVLLVADATADPSPGPTDAAVFAPRERGGPRVTLVLRHPPGTAPTGTARWLRDRPTARHLHIGDGVAADLERVGRWVTGTSVGLVLGAGGARGWAHIGAVRAMAELGIPIDLVGGTSQGAVVGAAVADRRSWDDMLADARPRVHRLRDYTLPLVSVLAGKRLGATLSAVVRPGIDVEDLWLPYFAMTTNLSRAERVVQDRGSVVRAMRASVALPVMMPPVVRGGDVYIDGGLLDHLPVREMRRRVGSGRIVAIDPSRTPAAETFDPLEGELSGVRLLAERLVPGRRRRRVPSIGEMVQRTIVAGSRYLRSQTGDPDPRTLLLRPELGEYALLAFEHLDEIVEAGYRELRGPLATWWAAQQEV